VSAATRGIPGRARWIAAGLGAGLLGSMAVAGGAGLISQLAEGRPKAVTDVVKEGDMVWVKLLGFDDRGKVRLSMKVVDQTTGRELQKAEAS